LAAVRVAAIVTDWVLRRHTDEVRAGIDGWKEKNAVDGEPESYWRSESKRLCSATHCSLTEPICSRDRRDSNPTASATPIIVIPTPIASANMIRM
jgi:hypothetical protein